MEEQDQALIAVPATTPRNLSYKDPTTGFITADQANAFSASKKVEFLRVYRANLNKTAGAESVGITVTTINEHLEFDKVFQRAFNEAKMSVQDRLVHKATEFAQKPQNVRDRWELINRIGGEWAAKQDGNQINIQINVDGEAHTEVERRKQMLLEQREQP